MLLVSWYARFQKKIMLFFFFFSSEWNRIPFHLIKNESDAECVRVHFLCVVSSIEAYLQLHKKEEEEERKKLNKREWPWRNWVLWNFILSRAHAHTHRARRAHDNMLSVCDRRLAMLPLLYWTLMDSALVKCSFCISTMINDRLVGRWICIFDRPTEMGAMMKMH